MTAGGGGTTARRPAPRLAALGALSALLYAYLAFGLEIENSLRSVGSFLVACAALFALCLLAYRLGRRPRRAPVALIFAFAALFRGLLLFAGLPAEGTLAAARDDLTSRQVTYGTFLLYDNDVWRYLWDGHLLAHGLSPYADPPRRLADADPPPAGLLDDDLWWDVLDNVSFQRHTTVYPPVALYLFRAVHAVAPGSVLALKAALATIDLAVCWLLLVALRQRGRDPAALVLYAWNPLPVTEVAGSGHADPLMVALAMAALLWVGRQRPIAAWIALATSTLSKLSALLLAPLLARRAPAATWVLFPLALAACLAPLASTLGAWGEGLAVYGRDWQFNAGPWAAVAWLAGLLGATRPELWAHGVTKVLLALAVARVWWRDREGDDPWRGAFLLLALPVLLHSAVMPWYVLWALPLAVVAGSRAWVALSGLVLLSYLFYVGQVEHAWWRVIEYGGFFAVAAWDWKSWREDRSPRAR